MKYSRYVLLLPLLPALVVAQPERKRGAATPAATSAPTTAEKPAAGEVKPADKKEEKEPVLSVTEHQLTLGGKVIKYKKNLLRILSERAEFYLRIYADDYCAFFHRL